MEFKFSNNNNNKKKSKLAIIYMIENIDYGNHTKFKNSEWSWPQIVHVDIWPCQVNRIYSQSVDSVYENSSNVLYRPKSNKNGSTPNCKSNTKGMTKTNINGKITKMTNITINYYN